MKIKCKKNYINNHVFVCFFYCFFNYLVEINETVICTNDHMEVIIPSAFFLNKVPPVYVSNQQLKSAFL